MSYAPKPCGNLVGSGLYFFLGIATGEEPAKSVGVESGRVPLVLGPESGRVESMSGVEERESP